MALGANTWTRESWSSAWSFPDDVLTRADAQNNGFCDLALSGFGAGSADKTWTFAEPKDISSVQILMAGNSYKVSEISVQYAGTEDFVTVDGSALDFSQDTGGNTRMVFANSDSRYFVEDVVGLRIVLTDIYPHWANAQEILVTGKTRGVSHRWKVGTYAEGEWAPAADRLKGLTNGADSWGAPAANLEDDDTASHWYSSGQTLVWNFDAPKRIRRIRLAGADGAGGGFKVNSVSVRFQGSDDYVVIPGSTLDYFNTLSYRYSAEFSADDGLVASSVVSVKIAMSVLSWRFAIGEAEIDGEDSFVSTLDADYLVENGRLNTKLKGVASAYPKQVFICSGEEDGGKDVTRWNDVRPVGELTDAETPFEDSRLVDFRFCRFFFPDIDNEAWSEPFELVLEPSATARVAERRSTDARIEAVIDFCGGTNEVAAVYLAYAPEGEALPAYALLEDAVQTGRVVSAVVTGLSSLSAYAYRVKVVNADGGEAVVAGGFETRGDAFWEKGEYKVSEWVRPVDRMYANCTAGGNVLDGDLSTYNAYMASNSVITCTWNDPVDIDFVEALWIGGDAGEILRVEIRYEGDDAYHPLSGTHVNYRESVSGRKMATLRGSGGALGSRVTGLKFVSGYWGNNWANGFAELIVHGKYSDSDLVWDLSRIAAEDYAPADDYLEGYKEGYAVVHDKNIATGQDRVYSGETYVWNFDKPKDIRQMRFYLNSASVGFGQVQIKRKGDTDYTSIPGSALSIVEYSGSGPLCAILRTPTGLDGYIVRNVVSVKIAVNSSLYINTPLEVEVDGRDYVSGLKFIIR